MSEIRKQAATNAIHTAINEVRSALAHDIGEAGAAEAVNEAASAAEALHDLREDLATGTLGFDSLDAYDKAKQAGQLSTEQEIIIIGVRPVLGGNDDQPKEKPDSDD